MFFKKSFWNSVYTSHYPEPLQFFFFLWKYGQFFFFLFKTWKPKKKLNSSAKVQKLWSVEQNILWFSNLGISTKRETPKLIRTSSSEWLRASVSFATTFVVEHSANKLLVYCRPAREVQRVCVFSHKCVFLFKKKCRNLAWNITLNPVF